MKKKKERQLNLRHLWNVPGLCAYYALNRLKRETRQTKRKKPKWIRSAYMWLIFGCVRDFWAKRKGKNTHIIGNEERKKKKQK